MAENAYDVFISYRQRKGGAEARLIRGALAERGLRAFLDVTDLEKGYFDETLLQCIADTPNFIAILTPSALDRCMENKEDWMRREIAHAILTRRTIVPVMFPEFKFPKQLPDDIRDLARHQGVKYSHDFFEAVIDKILWLVEAPAAEKRTTAIEQQERTLDAALPKRVPVGRATELVAMIRRPDSQGLKAILEIEEDPCMTPGDVRSKGVELEFPLDASGQPQSAELVLRLDAPDFEPQSQSKRVLVPPKEDSELYRFLLTAHRKGELKMNLEVLKGDLCMVTRSLKTLAETQGSEYLTTGSVLVSIPLYVYAYRTDTRQVQVSTNPTVASSLAIEGVRKEETRDGWDRKDSHPKVSKGKGGASDAPQREVRVLPESKTPAEPKRLKKRKEAPFSGSVSATRIPLPTATPDFSWVWMVVKFLLLAGLVPLYFWARDWLLHH